MKETHDPTPGPLRRRADDAHNPGSFAETGGNGAPRRAGGVNGSASGPVVDPWSAIDLLLRRWHWPVLGALVFAGLFFVLGEYAIREKHTARAQLMRYEPPGDSDFFNSSRLTTETFSGLIKSPELMERVSSKMFDIGVPVLPPDRLVKAIKIEPEPDSDMITVLLAAPNAKHAVELLNLYVNEAVAYTRELQQAEAGRLAKVYLERQVSQMQKDIDVLEDKFRALPNGAQLTNALSSVDRNLSALGTNLAVTVRPNALVARQAERLQQAMLDLNDLLTRYTELHPAVKAKESEIRDLTNRIAQASSSGASVPLPLANALTPTGCDPNAFNPEIDIIRMRLLSLEEGRVGLMARQREAALYAENPPGIARVFAPATAKTTESNMRWLKVALVTLFGGGVGLLGSLMLAALVEFADNRLKTVDDVRRVTRLPVLASLGDLERMSPGERSQWAFRAWTMLQGRLSPSANHGLVCGVTSSSPGQGRSTWISLLAEAASMTGFRVLTIATRPSPSPTASTDAPREPEPNGTALEEIHMKHPNNGTHALTTSVLSAPMQVTEKLTGPNSQPMVHIPLPGWVWNLDRRKQWGEALAHWRQIENLVILVELPPASVPEAVLLGSNLPNLLWLTQSGNADAADTRAQLQTLRHARCNMVGAVLNREDGASLRKRFPRWLGCLAALACLSGLPAGAQFAEPPAAAASPAPVIAPATAVPAADSSLSGRDPQPTAYADDAFDSPPSRNAFFSVVQPSQRAEWQKRLTLGAGDIINIGLYGAPELTRTDVAIGPDGRVSFLEAQDVLAAGLTIDEFRARLDEALGKYRRAPRTIVVPVSFLSKKYYLLGKIMTKGAYTLDRPMTVLEAIARAKGMENGLVDRNIVDLADFQRALLVRDGKRIPLNFEKLFQQGDLSQNVPIEPGDYIYFPGKDAREVYVVGEVRLPGPVFYTDDLTIIGAIAARGGYTERAFKMRVVVVRGSINNPEKIVVDTHGILDGRKQDFRLQPRDIIYVNSRPFILVEEAADVAATAFIQSLITTWVGQDVVKPF